LAGSSAQLEMPTKAHFMYGSGVILLSSQPSSSRGCRVYKTNIKIIVNNGQYLILF